MKLRMTASILVVALLSAVAVSADDNDKKREKTRKMADQTLQDLYKLEPTAQVAIQKAAGYAVFNNMGTNLLLISTARRRNRRQLPDKAGNLYENDFCGCRPGCWSRGL
jgi:hypothetical protein